MIFCAQTMISLLGEGVNQQRFRIWLPLLIFIFVSLMRKSYTVVCQYGMISWESLRPWQAKTCAARPFVATLWLPVQLATTTVFNMSIGVAGPTGCLSVRWLFCYSGWSRVDNVHGLMRSLNQQVFIYYWFYIHTHTYTYIYIYMHVTLC